MSIDPMQLVAETRPKPSSEASSFQPQSGAMRRTRQTILQDHSGNERSVDELDGKNPAVYRARIQPPPCARCHQDHNPIAEAKNVYDHEYLHPDMAEHNAVVMLNPAEAPPVAVETLSRVAPASNKRVSVFPGRGEDNYVLVVEQREDDDWEDLQSFKVDADRLAGMLPVLRLLDVKIKDRTGGDLVRVNQEHE